MSPANRTFLLFFVYPLGLALSVNLFCEERLTTYQIVLLILLANIHASQVSDGLKK